jgi:hypothetical protein
MRLMGAARRHPIRASVAGVILAAVGFGLYWFSPQALFLSNTVNEPPPAVAVLVTPPVTSASATPAVLLPVTVAQGSFRSLEHQTTGQAILLRFSNGTVILRIENLDTSNGPDVHVTLSPDASTTSERDYNSGYLDLGSLKGNKGNQNYLVPAGTDLSRYRSAVIWCKRFSVGFGVAPIM